MEKKEHTDQQEKQKFPEQIARNCYTFTSHELFWRELNTIVEEGAQMAED